MPDHRRSARRLRTKKLHPATAAGRPASIHHTGGKRHPAKRRLPYDSAFHRAVVAGFLTPQEAEKRGRRADFAARIAEEHGLPLGLATLVADNAISVNLACRRLAEIDPAAGISARRRSPRRAAVGWLSISGAGALVAAIFVFGLHSGLSSGPPVLPQYGANVSDPVYGETKAAGDARAATWKLVETTRNDEGLPTKLVGPNPESVLIAFCNAAPADAGVEPVGIALAIPESPSKVWGIFKLHGPAGVARRAIVISYDPKTLRWTTGDGRFVYFHDEDMRAFPAIEKRAARTARDSNGS